MSERKGGDRDETCAQEGLAKIAAEGWRAVCALHPEPTLLAALYPTRIASQARPVLERGVSLLGWLSPLPFEEALK